jgi:hypothetical protein
MNDAPAHVLLRGVVRAGGAAREHCPPRRLQPRGREVKRERCQIGPRRCQLAPASLWEYSVKRLKLAQFLGQLGVFLTTVPLLVGDNS